MTKTIGILGGMGPAATVDLFHLIVEATPAKNDQEHLPILINNDPSIPDRTAAILEGGENPLPKLIAGAQLLARMGAELIAIPCNSAHYYWADVQHELDIPVLHIIRETAAAIRQQLPDVTHVGVMGTAGTLKMRLYQDVLVGAGFTPVEPTETEIDQMMQGTHCVKAGQVTGEPNDHFKAVGQALIDRGAAVLVMGCTEIPLALHDGDLPAPLLSPTKVLAEAAVREAM